MHYRGFRRRKEREGDLNVFEENMAKNFPSLKKETNFQEQKAQVVPNKMDPNRPTPRHNQITNQFVIIKMTKLKNTKSSKSETYFSIVVHIQIYGQLYVYCTKY